MSRLLLRLSSCVTCYNSALASPTHPLHVLLRLKLKWLTGIECSLVIRPSYTRRIIPRPCILPNCIKRSLKARREHDIAARLASHAAPQSSVKVRKNRVRASLRVKKEELWLLKHPLGLRLCSRVLHSTTGFDVFSGRNGKRADAFHETAFEAMIGIVPEYSIERWMRLRLCYVVPTIKQRINSISGVQKIHILRAAANKIKASVRPRAICSSVAMIGCYLVITGRIKVKVQRFVRSFKCC